MLLAVVAALLAQAPPAPQPVWDRRAGKVATLVLLRANPLETVEAYDAIDVVVVRGKLLDRSVVAAR